MSGSWGLLLAFQEIQDGGTTAVGCIQNGMWPDDPERLGARSSATALSGACAGHSRGNRAATSAVGVQRRNRDGDLSDPRR